jgi:site-specific DNA-cytosine methylase
MTWLEAAATLEGLPGAEAPRRSKRGAQAPKKAKLSPWLDPTRPRPFPTIVIAADGTWHRPLTTLELAVLQGLPATVRGRPLQLAGNSSEQREHIGNAVPVGASRAIAEQMLKTLVAADEKGMFLSSTPIWVSPSNCVLEASP